MNYLSAGCIHNNITLGDISNMVGFMNQDMVPGLIAVGLRGIGMIPIIISPAGGIEIDDNTAVGMASMYDSLPRDKEVYGIPLR